MDATSSLQEQYNKKEFLLIASSLDGQAADSGVIPLGQRRAFLERLLPHLRAGTGSCDTASASYRVHKVSGKGILVRAAFSCEASALTYFATWQIGTHARLVDFQIDGDMWQTIPGLWSRRVEIVGIEE